MSGPKLDKAEIEARRQEELERQRQEELKKLKAAQNAYRDECTKLENLSNMIDDLMTQSTSLYVNTEAHELMALKNKINIVQVKATGNIDDYNMAANEMKANYLTCKADADRILGRIHQRMMNEGDLNSKVGSYQQFLRNSNDSGVSVEALTIDFSCRYDYGVLIKRLQDMQSHFFDLVQRKIDPELTEFSKKALTYIEALLSMRSHTLDIKTVNADMQRIINNEQEIIRLASERNELYSDYCALSSILGREPKPPEDFASIKILETEVQELNALYKELDEMDYIADQINQVMIEFGYSFVSSKVLQKEGGSEADYSLYAADTDTGIEVYTDQSGSVLMRVAVLGDDPQITAHDQDFSYQRQLDFCASHMDLVEALAEKGILLRQKNYYAPDKKHTAKVAVGKNIVSNAAVRRRVEDRRGRRRGKRAKMRSL